MVDQVNSTARGTKGNIDVPDGFPSGTRTTEIKVSPEKMDKVTRRVIAPYAQIERKGGKDEQAKDGVYIDISRFTMFVEDTVDLDSLLYETAMVLKNSTNSTGAFVYLVDKARNEIVFMSRNTVNQHRHQVNIPISEGKITAAHVAATKEHVVMTDVPRDRRFTNGLMWVDAKVALCMPVLKPDGDCHAVLELYRTHSEPYTDEIVHMVMSVSCWAGAAIQQTLARLTLQKTAHLNAELLSLLHTYFTDFVSLDSMITDMLSAIKLFLSVRRSCFFVIDKENIHRHLLADMWDDGWPSEKTTMPKKKLKINLSQEQTPAGMVARSGLALNVPDAYKDPRFVKEVDPVTGSVVRATLVWPVTGKDGVTGVVQLINKQNGEPFDSEDEKVFDVFVNYCSLVVHFASMQQNKIYHNNMNKVYSELIALHLHPCSHDFGTLMKTGGVISPPSNFHSYDYCIDKESKGDIPGLICYMYLEMFDDEYFDRSQLADFVLTILGCYRDNPYHNAEHAFCFTHTMYLILTTNHGYFNLVEMIALMLAGLCHDLDHPGYNNNFLKLNKHPLSLMYKYSSLEYHHYFIAKKIIEDKKLLDKLCAVDKERIIEEMKYDILCTDIAVYFQVRAQLTPIVAEHNFEWIDSSHRKMLKGILMTTSDLSGCCKPFGKSKQIAEALYEEFYNQGDRERAMGYTPLSMMDRRHSTIQPAEQIQFLSVVVLPCLNLLQNIFPNTSPLLENCKNTQEAWFEEIEIRGQKLWRQSDSLPNTYTENK